MVSKVCLGLLVSLGMTCGLAWACSVPVFRYALERWRADAYEVILFHRGPLTSEQHVLVRALDPEGGEGSLPANLAVRQVDLNADPAAEMVELKKQLPADIPLPAVAVRFPRMFGNPAAIWSGPLSRSTVQQIVDSPMRRDLARRLLKGDSAVWVLLGIGDKARDDAAAHLLEKRLRHLEQTLQLQKLDPADVAGGLVSVAEDQLKVAFSLVRLSRTDPAEQILIPMLLGIEDDLHQMKEPIAFPVFGRGRALFALAGKGIQNETIDEACTFLTGPCSCQVKELNPGVDLLMAVDWEEEVYAVASATRPLPELSGVAGFGTNQPVSAEPVRSNPAKPGPAAVSPAAPVPDRPAALPAAPGENRPLLVSLAVVGGAGLLIVAGGTFLLLRRKRS